MPSCLVCSHANEEGAEYCEECGVKLGAAPSPETPTATDDAPLMARPPAAAAGAADAEAGPPAGDATGPATCPNCNAAIPTGSQFCSQCGSSASAQRKGTGTVSDVSARQCPSCGTAADPKAAFCARCGTRIDAGAAAARPRGEAIRLRVVAGKEKDRLYDVEKKEVRIGRHPDNDIPLEMDGYVSGKHTLIVKDGKEYFIEDMGSTNGTFIRVRQRIKVTPGDEFKIGQSIFRLEE